MFWSSESSGGGSKVILCLTKSVCQSLFANCRSFFFARSSQEMSQTVRIYCQSFLSRVRISVRSSNFYISAKPQKQSRNPSSPRECSLECTSDTGECSHGWSPPTSRNWSPPTSRNGNNLSGDNCIHSWSPATHRNGDNLNGDNCGHSSDRLNQNGKKSKWRL